MDVNRTNESRVAQNMTNNDERVNATKSSPYGHHPGQRYHRLYVFPHAAMKDTGVLAELGVTDDAALIFKTHEWAREDGFTPQDGAPMITWARGPGKGRGRARDWLAHVSIPASSA